MTYQKPEVEVLGETSYLIRGPKNAHQENNDAQFPSDCEFDD